MKMGQINIVIWIMSVVLGIIYSNEAIGSEKMFRNTPPLQTMEWLPKTQPDARIRYAAENALQFGDLRLPAGNPPTNGWPLAIFVHGGAWHADYNKDYSSSFVEALTETGVATWGSTAATIGGGPHR